MRWKDDDDVLPSPSTQEAVTRADKGKKEELKRQIQRKSGQDRSAELRRTELKSSMDLQALQASLSGKKDEEKKRKERAEKEQKKEHAPKTKTRKELEQEQTETAHEKTNADTMIRRQQQQQDISDEETPSEQG